MPRAKLTQGYYFRCSWPDRAEISRNWKIHLRFRIFKILAFTRSCIWHYNPNAKFHNSFKTMRNSIFRGQKRREQSEFECDMETELDLSIAEYADRHMNMTGELKFFHNDENSILVSKIFNDKWTRKCPKFIGKSIWKALKDWFSGFKIEVSIFFYREMLMETDGILKRYHFRHFEGETRKCKGRTVDFEDQQIFRWWTSAVGRGRWIQRRCDGWVFLFKWWAKNNNEFHY